MKHLNSIIAALLFTTLLFVGSASVHAQSPEDVFAKVGSAIQAKSASDLVQYFHSSVEVTVPEVDKTFSAQQAQFVLDDFFKKSTVQSFKQLHKGNSGATYYMIGRTVTAKGAFDTNVFLKKIGDEYKVTQIRFEED